MTDTPTRVVVVEDSATQRAFLRRSLEAEGDITVVGEASTAASAVAAVLRGAPDLVTLDLNIPGGGQSAIERIMEAAPKPILVLSGTVDSRAEATRALEAGAAGIMIKPLRWNTAFEQELRRRVRTLRNLRIKATESVPKAAPVHAVESAPTPARNGSFAKAGPGADPPGPLPGAAVRRHSPFAKIVAIAASTGGPGAVGQVLKGLAGLDLPIVLVQHIGPKSVTGLAEWLSRTSGWRVRVARTGDVPSSGEALLGPGGKHLTVTDGGRIALVDEPKTTHQPSADVLFKSLARSMGSSTIAAVLTGMGADGAAGLLALHEAGAITIAQNEESSAVFGMAKAAIELGAIRHTVPLDAVAPTILRVARAVR